MTFKKETVLKAIEIADGHIIFPPEMFLDAGLPGKFVKRYTKTQRSNFSKYKEIIMVNGEAVKSLEGVYGLELLKGLADALDVEYEDKLGRGSQADAIKKAIIEYYKDVQLSESGAE
jgi:hypothetical protein